MRQKKGKDGVLIGIYIHHLFTTTHVKSNVNKGKGCLEKNRLRKSICHIKTE